MIFLGPHGRVRYSQCPIMSSKPHKATACSRGAVIEPLDARRLLSTVSVADAATLEGAGALTFTVTLDAPLTQDVVVSYVTTPVTAKPGKDYKPAVAGKVTIPAGSVSRMSARRSRTSSKTSWRLIGACSTWVSAGTVHSRGRRAGREP